MIQMMYPRHQLRILEPEAVRKTVIVHVVDSLGCMNNIKMGMIINLGMLNQTTCDSKTSIASVGAGANWMNVYAELYRHNVLVTGERDGDVGMSGLLVGSRSPFLMGYQGFSGDYVNNFEIVLARGTMINAHKEENLDLSRTRSPTLPTIIFPNDALVACPMTIPMATTTARFKKINIIPSIGSDDIVSISLADTAKGSQLVSSSWGAGATRKFKIDKRIIDRAMKIHDQYVKDLTRETGGDNFNSMALGQPMPRSFADISKKKGGIVLGREEQQTNSILLDRVR
ncbi:hypothetical protein FQN50_002147 [Emmonsiellopsis sp. PD_5]|nr:hypothetical protein FQN50_002147 [Emmonsiellopsis sp. PD_5]